MLNTIIALIIGVAESCLFGFATQRVIEDKGHKSNWFWWGFFFGVIALLIAAFQPVRISYSTLGSKQPEEKKAIPNDEAYSAQTLSTGGWKCSCGRVHAAYVSSCCCGKSKHDSKAN